MNDDKPSPKIPESKRGKKRKDEPVQPSVSDKEENVERKSAPVPLSPDQLAVPEQEEKKRTALKSKVIVPEDNEEDEEDIIAKSARPSSIEKDSYEKWFVLALAILGTLVILFSSFNVGMAWDEAYYLDAGLRTRDWIADLLTPSQKALTESAIQATWNSYELEPRGHGSVPRTLVALGMFLSGYDLPSLIVMRLPIAICYGLTLALLYLLARENFGRITGWLVVLSYFFMPRVFGHAHFAVTETPAILMTLLVFYAFLKGLHSTRWAVLTGIFLGIAMATKINALFIPVITLPWLFLFHRRQSVNLLYAIIFLTPLAMIAVWPWLWLNPGLGLAKYLLWNFGREQSAVFYGGQVYDAVNAVPWSYPFVMTALTVPIPILILMALGVARTLRAPRKHYVGILFLAAALIPLLIQALPSVPKYDGVRLFLPTFPFMALLAGIGGGVIVRIAAFYDVPGRFPKSHIVMTLIMLSIIIFGGIGLLRVQPCYLSYYNLLAGKRETLPDKMQVTYWGDCLNRRAIERINNVIPANATLTTRAMNMEVLRYYQKLGWLSGEIRLLEDQPADYHLVQYRKGFFSQMDWILFRHYEDQRVARFPQDGIPMFGLYKTGPDFERFWRSRSE
ncbi:MAG: ArnT family glycosyltransferase [Candidatus Sumerlaeia bacterium]